MCWNWKLRRTPRIPIVDWEIPTSNTELCHELQFSNKVGHIPVYGNWQTNHKNFHGHVSTHVLLHLLIDIGVGVMRVGQLAHDQQGLAHSLVVYWRVYSPDGALVECLSQSCHQQHKNTHNCSSKVKPFFLPSFIFTFLILSSPKCCTSKHNFGDGWYFAAWLRLCQINIQVSPSNALNFSPGI